MKSIKTQTFNEMNVFVCRKCWNDETNEKIKIKQICIISLSFFNLRFVCIFFNVCVCVFVWGHVHKYYLLMGYLFCGLVSIDIYENERENDGRDRATAWIYKYGINAFSKYEKTNRTHFMFMKVFFFLRFVKYIVSKDSIIVY